MSARVVLSRVLVPVLGATLVGELSAPATAHAVVLIPHASGAARPNAGSHRIAAALIDAGLATLVLDLLTESEAVVDARTGHLRFDIPLLAQRLVDATDWMRAQSTTSGLPVGYLGAETAAAAALVAAARSQAVAAVVCRAGRLDPAAHVLEHVPAPTLLIVGGDDPRVAELNRDALRRLPVEAAMEIVPGADDRFEKPGALETVAHLARCWFERHLGRPAGPVTEARIFSSPSSTKP